MRAGWLVGLSNFSFRGEGAPPHWVNEDTRVCLLSSESSPVGLPLPKYQSDISNLKDIIPMM